jgi:lysozyme family protein
MRLLLAALSVSCVLGGTLQENLWEKATVSPAKAHEARRIVDRIMAAKARYEAVDADTNVPWYVIAGLHNMESGGSFRHHLHEGSPLTRRTRYVPKGRPKTGSPPFKWEYSAKDALLYDRLDRVDWSRLHDTLYACERYNGTGYLRYHPSTPSPYLWAGTSVERPGKYVADGKWSSTARSSQLGISAVWKTMEARKILDFRKLKK